MTALELAAAVESMDAPDDWSTLVPAAKAGDLGAFETLMRRYERQVLATALRLLGNMADAQDACQEVFLKLHRNLGKLERSGDPRGWLYRVTVNVCHDLRRKRTAEEAIEEAEAITETSADPQRAATEAERQRALRLSLRMLPERERTAVVLRDLEGLSTEEVARAMGSSEATVRSQISQARLKMRGFLERYFRRRV